LPLGTYEYLRYGGIARSQPPNFSYGASLQMRGNAMAVESGSVFTIRHWPAEDASWPESVVHRIHGEAAAVSQLITSYQLLHAGILECAHRRRISVMFGSAAHNIINKALP